MALVEHLTRDCLLAPSASTDSGTRSARALRDARWRLDQSRHYERKARLPVEDLLDLCFAQPAATVTNGEDSVTGQESGLGTSPAPQRNDVAEMNPEWQQLQAQFSQLSEQMRRLVQHLTPNHPQIVDLAQRMELVRQQLAVTPQFVGSQVSEAVGSPGTPEGMPATQASHVANVVEALRRTTRPCGRPMKRRWGTANGRSNG